MTARAGIRPAHKRQNVVPGKRQKTQLTGITRAVSHAHVAHVANCQVGPGPGIASARRLEYLFVKYRLYKCRPVSGLLAYRTRTGLGAGRVAVFLQLRRALLGCTKYKLPLLGRGLLLLEVPKCVDELLDGFGSRLGLLGVPFCPLADKLLHALLLAAAKVRNAQVPSAAGLLPGYSRHNDGRRLALLTRGNEPQSALVQAA